MRQCLRPYPIVEIGHIVGFVVLVGAAVMFDLRLLGLSRRLAVADMARHLLRRARGSVALVVPSGLPMFTAHATEMAASESSAVPAPSARERLAVVGCLFYGARVPPGGVLLACPGGIRSVNHNPLFSSKEALMRLRIILSLHALLLGIVSPALGEAAPLNFKLHPTYSRATFKSDAPLETIVGTTAGPALEGRLTLDPADPTTARGAIRVDLSTLRSGVEKRDADMRGKDYLDVEGGEQNRWAVFTLTGVRLPGPLPPGQEREGTAKGVLTIKGRPVETEAAVRVTYLTLTPAQAEQQKRFGFTAENLKVRATFGTTFTSHGMQIPRLLFLKVANDLALEADLTFVRE